MGAVALSWAGLAMDVCKLVQNTGVVGRLSLVGRTLKIEDGFRCCSLECQGRGKLVGC